MPEGKTSAEWKEEVQAVAWTIGAGAECAVKWDWNKTGFVALAGMMFDRAGSRRFREASFLRFQKVGHERRRLECLSMKKPRRNRFDAVKRS